MILTLEVRRITSSSFPEVKSIVAVLDTRELCVPLAILWEGTARWVPCGIKTDRPKICKVATTNIHDTAKTNKKCKNIKAVNNGFP